MRRFHCVEDECGGIVDGNSGSVEVQVGSRDCGCHIAPVMETMHACQKCKRLHKKDETGLIMFGSKMFLIGGELKSH